MSKVLQTGRQGFWLVMALVALAALAAQSGCGYVAAGAVGAAVGHEVADREHDEDDD